MSAFSIQPTYPTFTDIDGQPLEDGYIFLGTINLDPIANPITAYFDAALTVTATQPIRTKGGYPNNAGAPGRIYVNSNYSIQVQNKNGFVIYSAPSATERLNTVVVVGGNPNRVVFTDGSGVLTDSANLTYTGEDLTVYGVRVGRGAGAVNTNTVVGAGALAANTGAQNTVVGALAAGGVMTGNSNTAVGYEALKISTSGIQNTAVGISTLRANTNGASNVAVGANALYAATASYNTAVGDSALFTVISGNLNTAVGWGSQILATGSRNTTVGSQASTGAMTGNDNVGVGYEALKATTSGNRNTAIGTQSAIGVMTGNDNVGVGHESLKVTTSGLNNTAIGTYCLRANTSGSANTAVGFAALYTAQTAGNNTAVGQGALYINSSGSENTAIGNNAMLGTTTGIRNVALGAACMTNTLIGNCNVAIGYQAMNNLTSGSGNTTINPMTGAGAYAPAFDITTQNNTISMGSTAVTNAFIQVAFTAVSDERDKTEIAPLTRGLNFVNQLQPVSYRFRVDRENEEAHGPTRLGFLAQEMLDVELSLDNRALVIDNDDENRLRYRSDAMVPILVKAIQELTARVSALEAV